MTRTYIIGLDPGLLRTGWGIIASYRNELRYVAHGVIRPCAKGPLAARLRMLFESLCEIMDKWQPGEAAIEETFVNNNASSSLRLGMARGVVLMTPAFRGIPVFEYGANKVKKTVTGIGHAEKDQVAAMVRFLLPGIGDLQAGDAADALAVAICHSQHRMVPALAGGYG